MEEVKQLSWLYELYRMGQSDALRETPAVVQQHILQHIVTRFEADTGSLALCRDDDCRELEIVAAIGLSAGVVGSIIANGECVLGWVTEKDEPLLLGGDISNDARFRNVRQRSDATRPVSAMCWPLRIEQRVIGALAINRTAERPPYTEEELKDGAVLVGLISVVIENAKLHSSKQQQIHNLEQVNQQYQKAHRQLEDAYHKLQDVQGQLLQSEKMASIGQLAAGVAHEINNPIGYVHSNIGSLQKYMDDLFAVVTAYEQAESLLGQHPEVLAGIRAVKQKADLEFLKEDVAALMNESREGITRVKKIVQDLKDFSHVDSDEEWVLADLHLGIDSTLSIVWNEIKYKAEVNKEYCTIPEVECLPAQLNQVFMNLLVNAAHAIEDRGVITVRSGVQGDGIWVEVADTGKGIEPEHLSRIFEPFFTTKPIGKGTGLGLSVSYSIIQKHHGSISADSTVGKGTTFRIELPVRQPEEVGTEKK